MSAIPDNGLPEDSLPENGLLESAQSGYPATMALHHPTQDILPSATQPDPSKDAILCAHCLRTATNGIKCQGICVADSQY
jgi:hypothetical protein